MGIEKIVAPRLTKSNVEVIRVVLDNDEAIICTPDHQFMLRDGSFVQAQDLKANISLMPISKKISKIEHRITIEGYEMVLNPKTHKWIFTHMLADQYNIENGVYNKKAGSHKHHIDFNKLNNNPNNLFRMDAGQHLQLHREQTKFGLHSKEAIAKCNKIKRSPEYRRRISQTMKEKLKGLLSARAKRQWADSAYKSYMAKKFLEFYQSHPDYQAQNAKQLRQAQKNYWSQKENRLKQADRVKKYFAQHPQAREYLWQKAKSEWANTKLLQWRKAKTKEQWTDEFRRKRKAAYNRTYLGHSLAFAKLVYEDHGSLKLYDDERQTLPQRDTNLLKYDTLVSRFFNGDQKGLLEAVINYNHKVKCIEKIPERMDVYDIEVPHTHNFALASGVFVHNSAKQGRDRRFQAILPIKGKILNVEKSRLDKILSNEEIRTIITALGTGVGEEFDLAKLRYHKLILMADADSLTATQPLVLYDKYSRKLFFTSIGDFVEHCVEPKRYQALSLNTGTKAIEWRDIYEVIKHPRRTAIYKLKTQNGYTLEITSCHSVYVSDGKECWLKEGKAIKAGDILILPRRLMRLDKQINIDLKKTLAANKGNKDIFVRLKKGQLAHIPDDAYIDLEISAWRSMQNIRQEKMQLSRHHIAQMAAVACKGIIQQWEQKIDNVMPKYGQLKLYLQALGQDLSNQDYYVHLPIRYWEGEGSDNGLKFYLDNHTRQIKTEFPLDEKLAYLLGWYLGDGCAGFIKGSPNRFTLSLGNDKAAQYILVLTEVIEELLAVKPVLDKRAVAHSINIHFHSFSFRLLLEYFGLLGKKAHEKFIPDEFFNVKEAVQKALLKGLLESDGYIISEQRKIGSTGGRKVVGYCTSSPRLAQNLIYILRQLGIFPAVARQWPKAHEYKGKIFRANYEKTDVYISAQEQIAATWDIWQKHKDADKLTDWLCSRNRRGRWGKPLLQISPDCVGLKITAIEKIDYPDKYVYDLSVTGNQNFVAGEGGIVCHNTDGSHIRTLLLTLLYRQMPKLVEDGYVYIAQPPLFKIKRGQREEYIQTEKQMNEILLELGREGLKFIRGKEKRIFTDNQFKELLGLLVELKKIGQILEKKGVETAKYLNFRHPKTKKMPMYRVKVEGKEHFLYSDKELSALADKENKEMQEDVLEFYEAQEVEQIISRLEKLGLDISTYTAPSSIASEVAGKKAREREQVKPKAPYRIIDGKEEKELFSLQEVLAFVQEAASQGMHIQRYKGLGEMNPQQLWETTMDPEKRTLLKVTLEDAVEADKMFTVLMGDQVEPRREFIENYAHQVKNLDI
jgi:DNA gyrase/topoisomerase IV subunit B